MSLKVVLDIIKYPNIFLKTKSQIFTKDEILNIGEGKIDIKPFANLMRDTMYAYRAVGLAGPQVSWGKRIVAVDTSYLNQVEHPIIVLNPELHDLKGKQIVTEGCLSFPHISLDVERYEEGILIGKDLDWNDISFYVSGFECAVWQHEIDHLNGELFISRISRVKKDIALRKYYKMRKRNGG